MIKAKDVTVMQKIKRMLNSMSVTNVLFHPTRNSPRNRERYYFLFISIVGYDDWKNINETVRVNWEASRLSFDRMYGMIRSFVDNAEEYNNLLTVPPGKEESEPTVNQPRNTPYDEMLKASEKIEELNKEYTNVLKTLLDVIDSAESTLKLDSCVRGRIKQLAKLLNTNSDN